MRRECMGPVEVRSRLFEVVHELLPARFGKHPSSANAVYKERASERQASFFQRRHLITPASLFMLNEEGDI